MKFPNEIKAYQTSDGTLHVAFAEASAHEHKLYVNEKIQPAHEILWNIWNDGGEPTPATTEAFLRRKAVQEAITAIQGPAGPAIIGSLISASTELLKYVKDELPEPNCSCHISPPCNDCVENSFPRELCSDLEEVLKNIQKGDAK